MSRHYVAHTTNGEVGNIMEFATLEEAEDYFVAVVWSDVTDGDDSSPYTAQQVADSFLERRFYENDSGDNQYTVTLLVIETCPKPVRKG